RNPHGEVASGGEGPGEKGGEGGGGGAVRSPGRGAGLADPPSRGREGGRNRKRGGGHEPLLPAPVQREASLRDRILPGAGPAGNAPSLRRAPHGGAEDPRESRELPRRHRRQLLRHRLSALMGTR